MPSDNVANYKCNTQEKRNVIIVCEISGLTAERHINTRGIPVVILEGRDCLGGCIHTMDIAGSGTTWVDLITS